MWWVIAVLICGCGRSGFVATPDGLPVAGDGGGDGGGGPDAFEDDRVYSTFSPCPTELAFVGQASCGGGRLVITPDSAQAAGAAWLAIPYPTNASLSLKVKMQITTLALPADGAVIVLQNDPRGTTAIGGPGGVLGYGSITPSLALELDTFGNVFEIAGEHVGLDLDGDYMAGQEAAAPFTLSDGTPFVVWLDYDKTAHVASAYIARTEPKPASPIVTIQTDLTHLGSRLFIGFTAGTGDDHESHQVLSLAIDVTP